MRPKRLPIFPIPLDGTAPETLPAFLRLFQATPWNGVDPLAEGREGYLRPALTASTSSATAR